MDKTESYGTMLNPAPYVVKLQKERDDAWAKLDSAQERAAEWLSDVKKRDAEIERLREQLAQSLKGRAIVTCTALDEADTRAEKAEAALIEEKQHHAHDVEGLAQSCKNRLAAEDALEEQGKYQAAETALVLAILSDVSTLGSDDLGEINVGIHRAINILEATKHINVLATLDHTELEKATDNDR